MASRLDSELAIVNNRKAIKAEVCLVFGDGIVRTEEVWGSVGKMQKLSTRQCLRPEKQSPQEGLKHASRIFFFCY